MTANIPIDVSVNSSKAEAGSRRVTRSLDDIRKKASDTDPALKRMNNSMKNTGAMADYARNSIRALASAMGIKEIIQAASSMQQLEARMKTVTGSAAAAAETMTWLRRTAKEQSTDIVVLADGYNRLLPSVKANILTMNEARTMMRLVNDNIKAFGLTTAQTSQLFLGLSQTFGSGQVTLEDLRQVTDQLPGTFNNLAVQAGLTTQELKKFISEGVLTGDMLKGPLTLALMENAGAAENLGNTFQSSMIRAKNSFYEFAKSIGDLGLFKLLQVVMDNVSNAVDFLSVVINKLNLGIANLIGNETSIRAAQQSYSNALSTFTESEADRLSAQRKANSEKELAIKLAKEEIARNGTLGEQMKKAAEDKKKADEAARNAATAARKAQADFNSLIESNLGPLEKYKTEMEEIEKLSKNATTSREWASIENAVKKTNKELEDSYKIADKFAEQQDDIAEIFKNTANDIKDYADTTFEKIFDGITGKSKFTFKTMFDDGVTVFKKMLASMAAAAIAKPILIPMVQSIGQSLGLSSASLNSIVTSLGGPSSIVKSVDGTTIDTNNMSMGGMDSTLPWMQGAGAAAAGSWMFSQGASSMAAQLAANMGFGPGSAGLTTMANFGGVAGSVAGIGAGFAGNFLANKLFGDDRGIGATIGGAAGGAAGGLLAASPLLGFGPMGIAAMIGLGAFGGNFLGGLFGGGRPAANMQSYNVDLANGDSFYNSAQSFQGKKFSQDNKDAAGDIAGFAGTIAMAAGGIAESLRVSVGRPGGGKGSQFVTQFGEAEEVVYGTVEELLEGITSTIADKAGKLNDDVRAALKKVDFAEEEQAMKDLDFIFKYNQLFQAPEQTFTTIERAVDDMNKVFEQSIVQAQRLGLSEKVLSDQREKAIANLRRNFDKDIQNQIANISNPAYGSLMGLADNQAIRRRDAIAAGGDLVEVEKLFALERQQVLKAAMEQQSRDLANGYEAQRQTLLDNLDQTLRNIDSIRTSISLDRDLGGLNSFQRMEEGDRSFEALAARIQGGDQTALSDLDGTINAFLQANLDYYGSTQPYLEKLAKVDILLDDAKNLAQNQFSVQEEMLKAQLGGNDIQAQMLEENIKQTELLNRQLGDTSSDIAKFGGLGNKVLNPGDTEDTIKRLYNEKNQLSEYLVRSAKYLASNGKFDFSRSDYGNTISFSDFLATQTDGAKMLERFNNIIIGLGGVGQNAKGTGRGKYQGKTWVGEQGPELVNFSTPVQIMNHEDSMAYANSGEGSVVERAFSIYARQSSKETAYLGGLLEQIVSLQQELNDNVGLGGLNG